LQISGLLEKRASFMGSCDTLDFCQKVIIGLPMDTTASFRPGTRFAPFRLREVSEGLEEYSVYQAKSLQNVYFYDAGDVILPFGNVGESLRRIELVANYLLSQNKRIFAIGGEHLVSYPIIKAYHLFYSSLAVIQMDAHADLREEYLGEKFSHATVMRHVAEEIGGENLFQLGIRSGTREEMEYASRKTNMYIDKSLPVLGEITEKIGNRPVYISLDIDVLDPAFAPGTGTPEPGGITPQELLRLLYGLGKLNIVGFDVVEISPPYDCGDNTSILGAKIIREALLAY